MLISGKSISVVTPCLRLSRQFTSARFNSRKGFNWELEDQLKPWGLPQADEVYIKDLAQVKSKIQALKMGGSNNLRIVTGIQILGRKNKETNRL